MTIINDEAGAPGVVDQQALQDAMAHCPTSVAVITAIGADGAPLGMVVGSFANVSMEPPLISFMPSRSSRTFAGLREAGSFTVNVLAYDQEWVCRAFAQRETDPFSVVGWTPSANGAPALDGAVTTLDCRYDAILPAGDHFIALGAVDALAVTRSVAPLLFFQRGYGGFTPSAFMAPTDRELAENVRLVQAATPVLEGLSDDLGVEVVVFARIGEHAAAVATAAGLRGDGQTVLGSRFPLMAPLGDLFIAWEPEEAIECWLDRLRHAAPGTREQLRARLAQTRAQGWAYTLRSEPRDQELVSVLSSYGVDAVTPAAQREMEDVLRRSMPSYQALEFVPELSVPLGNMVAPIRDATGRVRMTIRMSGFGDQVRGGDVEPLAERLIAAAEAVSAAIF